MTGAERYADATELLERSRNGERYTATGQVMREEAMVQAMLATAAATIDAARVTMLIHSGAKTAGGTARTLMSRWHGVTGAGE